MTAVRSCQRGKRIKAAMVAAVVCLVSLPSIAEELMERPLTELTRMLSDGEVTAVELVEAALAKAKDLAHLNALISIDAERALNAARKVDATLAEGGVPRTLAGIPMVVKDNINIAGLKTTGGTPGISFVAEATAPAAVGLEEADA
ncbi:MAG: amidase family protein, partial [Pseudomonadota bacterium]